MKISIKVLVVASMAVGICFTQTVLANFEDISVNGVDIDRQDFESFKDYNIPERYCYPNTDKLVINRVVGRFLINDESKRRGLSAEALAAQHKELKNGSMPDDPVAHYLELLSQNNELIVDVTMLRTAKLSFQHRYEAEEILERLETGESLDDIASGLGISGEYFETSKLGWQHVQTLAGAINAEPIAEGTLFNTWYSSNEWHVRQALEVRQVPVVLLNDDVDENYLDLAYMLKILTERELHQALVKELWDSAKVTIAGKPAAYSDESYCGFPQLLNSSNL